jgi:hypothetical protein
VSSGWTATERSILRYYYDKMTTKELAERLERTKLSVQRMARLMGLPPKDDMVDDGFTKRESLCWTCANSVPNHEEGRGCSWSINFQPVDGWTATPTKLRAARNGPPVDSFCVMACPKFMRA